MQQPSVSRGKMAEDYSEAKRSQQARETVQSVSFSMCYVKKVILSSPFA